MISALLSLSFFSSTNQRKNRVNIIHLKLFLCYVCWIEYVLQLQNEQKTNKQPSFAFDYLQTLNNFELRLDLLHVSSCPSL